MLVSPPSFEMKVLLFLAAAVVSQCRRKRQVTCRLYIQPILSEWNVTSIIVPHLTLSAELRSSLQSKIAKLRSSTERFASLANAYHQKLSKNPITSEFSQLYLRPVEEYYSAVQNYCNFYEKTASDLSPLLLPIVGTSGAIVKRAVITTIKKKHSNGRNAATLSASLLRLLDKPIRMKSSDIYQHPSPNWENEIGSQIGRMHF